MHEVLIFMTAEIETYHSLGRHQETPAYFGSEQLRKWFLRGVCVCVCVCIWVLWIKKLFSQRVLCEARKRIHTYMHMHACRSRQCTAGVCC